MSETNTENYLARINSLFHERESLFSKREEELKEQRRTLNALQDSVRKERKELHAEREELEARKVELDEQEQMLSDWQKEEKAARDKLNREKEEFAFKMQLELEEVKNERIRYQQLNEQCSDSLHMMGLLSNDGAEGSPVELFKELLKEDKTESEEMKRIKEENDELHEKLANLTRVNEELELKQLHFDEERKKLLEMIAKYHPAAGTSGAAVKEAAPETFREADLQAEAVTEEEELPDMEEVLPEEEGIVEETTAVVLKRYIEKNGVGYTGTEIRHSDEGEQLHTQKDGMNYVFLFTEPASFELSVSRKNNRSLTKILSHMNKRYPGVQFRYEDGLVYATGYFTSSITPGELMERVERIRQECFA